MPRHYIFDLIEFIGNQIAFVSHELEVISYLKTLEQTDAVVLDIQHHQELVKTATSARREAMFLLKGKDELLWCATKHVIASYMYATEVRQATYTTEAEELMEFAYQQMIAVLSKYLGQPVTTCGRCLQDKIKQVLQEEIIENTED